VRGGGGRLSYSRTLGATEQEGEVGRLRQAAAEGEAAAGERGAATGRQTARFAIASVACVPGRITLRGSRAGDGKLVMQMDLFCPTSSGPLVIHDDWSTALGGHFQTIMSVRFPDRPSVELAFTEERRNATVNLA